MYMKILQFVYPYDDNNHQCLRKLFNGNYRNLNISMLFIGSIEHLKNELTMNALEQLSITYIAIGN